MNQKSIVVKAAAIASSVLLLGAFIAYRVGAFDHLRTPSRADYMGGSKTKMILSRGDIEKLHSTPGASPNGVAADSGSRTFMADSKYVVVSTPNAPVTSAKTDSTPSPAEPK